MQRLFILLLCLLCLSNQPLSAKHKDQRFKYQLSICAIFQNEARFLDEWIRFHQLVGVEHFWLYNNSSTDDYMEVLRPYINAGIVELYECPSDDDWNHFCFHTQPGVYTNCLNLSRGKSKWVAFIDLDEFIVPVKSKSIPKILEKKFSNCSGVCVNWVMYGTSHIAKIEPGELMIEKLIMRAPLNYSRNRYVKSIVQPMHAKKCNNPHFCLYKPPHFHVNTHGERFEMEKCPIYTDVLRINHYWVRDEDYLHNVKVPRYDHWGVGGGVVIEAAKDLNVEEDRIMDRFVPYLK